ncbi:phage baseplate assembly protein V [Streptomyces sp. NPDC004111]|uniref:phage baseplate assembly protein V n=1 Tax=Streptomyces sp. NPDC004111 TaxID=3364690 RepID=UPI003679BB0E
MAELDLFALLSGQAGAYTSELDATAPRIPGVTLGVVTEVNDHQGLGRVKVRTPLLSEHVESAWARIAVPWAGQRRGSYLLPEVDDEVLVAFRHGDPAHPYVIGFLWNEQDPPPERDPGRDRRELRSRKGHVVRFDDTEGAERVTVASQGGLRVTLDDAAGEVTVAGGTDGAGPRTRVVVAGRRITVVAPDGDIALRAPRGEVAIEAATVRIEATGGATVSGQPVHLNPPVPALPPLSAGTA